MFHEGWKKKCRRGMKDTVAMNRTASLSPLWGHTLPFCQSVWKKKKKSIKNIFLRIRIFFFLSFSSAAKQCSRPVYAGTGGVGEIRDESWRGNTWWVLHVFVNARIDYTENVKVKVILSVFIKKKFPSSQKSAACKPKQRGFGAPLPCASLTSIAAPLP